MLGTDTGRLAWSVLVKTIGWAGAVHTFMEIVGGKLSGSPLLGLVGGGLVYGMGLFAFGFYNRSPAAHSS